jgi:hypothetical protein
VDINLDDDLQSSIEGEHKRKPHLFDIELIERRIISICLTEDHAHLNPKVLRRVNWLHHPGFDAYRKSKEQIEKDFKGSKIFINFIIIIHEVACGIRDINAHDFSNDRKRLYDSGINLFSENLKYYGKLIKLLDNQLNRNQSKMVRYVIGLQPKHCNREACDVIEDYRYFSDLCVLNRVYSLALMQLISSHIENKDLLGSSLVSEVNGFTHENGIINYDVFGRKGLATISHVKWLAKMRGLDPIIRNTISEIIPDTTYFTISVFFVLACFITFNGLRIFQLPGNIFSSMIMMANLAYFTKSTNRLDNIMLRSRKDNGEKFTNKLLFNMLMVKVNGSPSDHLFYLFWLTHRVRRIASNMIIYGSVLLLLISIIIIIRDPVTLDIMSFIFNNITLSNVNGSDN